MADIFGYSFEEAQKAREESLPKNLTAGRYKMMVDKVEIGDHPFGGQFRLLGENETIGPDLEIRISCVLTEDANGFKEGWRHTLFFATMRPDKENPGKISKKAIIDRADLGDLTMACCGNKPSSEQELVRKQFYITFKETNAKDGKTYLNIDKIEPVSAAATAAPATSAASFNTDTPDWK
jgi:hypothetical protein